MKIFIEKKMFLKRVRINQVPENPWLKYNQFVKEEKKIGNLSVFHQIWKPGYKICDAFIAL